MSCKSSKINLRSKKLNISSKSHKRTKSKKSKKLSKKISKKSSQAKKQINKAKKQINKAKRNYKQKGGKVCSLGYAMVKGIQIPAINNVPGEIKFDDIYGRLNNGDCAPSIDMTSHPIIKSV